jgi:hypothetical protein
VARAHLHRQARAARDLLAPFSPSGIEGLRREVSELPRRHAELPAGLWSSPAPEVARLLSAATRRRGHEVSSFLTSVLTYADLPLARVAVARGVLALREREAIDEHIAAAALVDLDQRASALLAATIEEAVEVGHREPAVR